MKILLPILLFLQLKVYATFLYLPTGSRAVATGNQFVHSNDAFAAYNQPAQLGFIQQFAAGIYAERRFLTSGLDLLNGVVVLPTKTGTFGVSVNYFGNKNYNEKLAGLAFGKAFGKKFSAGLKFNYLNYSIAEYGQRNLFTFDISFQYVATDKISLGANIFNPLPLELEKVTGEKIPAIIRFGLAYMPAKKLQLLTEIEKDLVYKPNIKLGIDYTIADKFALRAGFNSYPLRGTFGLGFHYKSISIDASVVYQGVLGITPQVSLCWMKSKKDKQVKNTP